MGERVIIQPSAAALMHSERSIGYTFEAAVADIVDNSITAGADNIHILCRYDSQDPCVSILDDGCGMTGEKLRNAMKYGSTDPRNSRSALDMGRFGLGMKVASLSQCSVLTVASVCDGNISAYQWNMHLISETDQWISLKITEEECMGLSQYEVLKSYSSGTLVVWQDLDRIAIHSSDLAETLSNNLLSLRAHLGLIFHRYLGGDAGNINIYVNGIKIKPIDPFLSSNKYRQSRPPRTISYKGFEINVESYILPPISKMSKSEYDSLGGKDSIRRLQGYYVYRNKRLIIPGTLFRLKSKKELQNLARIKIDLPNGLDEEWRLDIKKSSADIPDDLKESIGQTLDDVLESSKRVYTSKGRKIKGQEGYVWIKVDYKDYCRYELNRDNPLLKHLIDSMCAEDQKKLTLLCKVIEETVPYQAIQADIDERKLSSTIYDAEYELELRMNALKLTSEKRIDTETILNSEPYVMHPKIRFKAPEENIDG